MYALMVLNWVAVMHFLTGCVQLCEHVCACVRECVRVKEKTLTVSFPTQTHLRTWWSPQHCTVPSTFQHQLYPIVCTMFSLWSLSLLLLMIIIIIIAIITIVIFLIRVKFKLTYIFIQRKIMLAFLFCTK